MDFKQRLLFCINKHEEWRAPYHLNNFLLITDVDEGSIPLLVTRWFEASEMDEETKKEKAKELIRLLTVNPESKVVQELTQNIFCLGLACLYVESFGIPDGALVKRWLRHALVEMIERQRLELLAGNLGFYYYVARNFDYYQSISSKELYLIALKWMSQNCVLTQSSFLEKLEAQGIIISRSLNDYRFVCAGVKKILADMSPTLISESEGIARIHLMKKFCAENN